MKKNMKEFYKPEDLERRVILILKILHESAEPLGARVIARRMLEQNIQLSERTVRYHLKIMDERGLTKLVGRRDGRMITDKGKVKYPTPGYRIKSVFPFHALMFCPSRRLLTSKRNAAWCQ